MVAIPASAIVQVTPGVIGAGGNGLDLSGLILTTSNRVPIGTVLTLSTVAAVAAYFGPSSQEVSMATVYFAGFDNSSVKPAALLFSRYPTTPAEAYLRGGSVGSLTLAQLQAITGTLIVTINGTVVTSSTINLSAATSFSNAATLIQTALGTGLAVYDSVLNAFVITAGTTGTGSTMSFATGTASTALKLTAATGAVTSQGAAVATPAVAMSAVVAQTQNFASFTTTFEPSTSDCVAFAGWNDAQANRFVYVLWDTDVTATTVNNTASAGYLIQQANYSGTVLIYSPTDLNHASFVMGAIASIDFDEANGRASVAFKAQSGLTPGVTNSVIATQLIANGYNFYGAYATANDQFIFFYPGSVTGQYDWIDSYIDQLWMNSGFQLALMTLLTTVRAIPYNAAGYALIEQALVSVINDAVTFGAIRSGVALSTLQAAEVDAQTNVKISDVLSQRGWYVQVQPASAQVRAARGSPPVKFFYTDGQSVQTISLSSIQVQ